MKYRKQYTEAKLVENKLSKDLRHKKLSGVCAGLAKHYNLPRIVVRLAAIGALIMLPMATGVAYIVASVLLPESRYS